MSWEIPDPVWNDRNVRRFMLIADIKLFVPFGKHPFEGIVGKRIIMVGRHIIYVNDSLVKETFLIVVVD